MNQSRVYAERARSWVKPGQRLGGGGEGEVFAVPGQPQFCLKLYHRSPPELDAKVAAMIRHPLAKQCIQTQPVPCSWPVELLRDHPQGNCIGYAMPKVSGQELHLVFDQGPRHRGVFCPDYPRRLVLAAALAETVALLHRHEVIVGDLSGRNALVVENQVTLIDADSFQIRQGDEVFRCPVGTEEYLAPELFGVDLAQWVRGPETDLHPLAVLVFQLLMRGWHPFDGVYFGRGQPPPRRARLEAGHWPFGRIGPYDPPAAAPRLEALGPGLAALFARAFTEGLRAPKSRPAASEWAETLRQAAQNLQQCWVQPEHWHDPALGRCPFCPRRAVLVAALEQLPATRPAVRFGRAVAALPQSRSWHRLRRLVGRSARITWQVLKILGRLLRLNCRILWWILKKAAERRPPKKRIVIVRRP